MSHLRYDRVNSTIRGIVAAVPETALSNEELDAVNENDHAAKSAAITGVLRRHMADGAPNETERLGAQAAIRLLANLGWHTSSIDALVFVTQTGGPEMPSGAHLLHEMLGLPHKCVPVQANYACAGYVHGLWLAGVIGNSNGATQRVLLIVGDTITHRCDPQDRATAAVFGDAVTATALEVGPMQMPIHLLLGTDANGWQKLSMRGGRPIQMDGTAVFNFTLRRVPQLLSELRDWGQPDTWLFHQANAFMLDHLIKKAGIHPSVVPTNLQVRGNTSSASIPLLMCDVGLRSLHTKRVAMVGFGAGWTWGGASTVLTGLQCAEAIVVGGLK